MRSEVKSGSKPDTYELALRLGIQTEWTDLFGQRHLLSDRAVEKILDSCHAQPTPSSRLAAPIYALCDLDGSLRGNIYLGLPASRQFKWKIKLNDGQELDGSSVGTSTAKGVSQVDELSELEQAGLVKLSLPTLPPGYHTLSISIPRRSSETKVLLLQSPAEAYLPRPLRYENRSWGVSARLLAVRSEKTWGMGDFFDLRTLCEQAIENGAGAVALQPLQPISELIAGNDLYSAATFIDPIYISTELAADCQESEAAVRLLASPELRTKLAELRLKPFIIEPVRQLKLEVLKVAYQHFRAHHVHHGTKRAQEFARFKTEWGERLTAFAIFQCLQEHFQAVGSFWSSWPEAYRSYATSLAQEFVSANSERLEFFQYLQWLAHSQLEEIRQLFGAKHLGLCLTVPTEFHPGGFETWFKPDCFCHTATSMSMSAYGRWGARAHAAAAIPARIREDGYSQLLESLRATMPYCSAIAIPDLSSYERRVWLVNGESQPALAQFNLEEVLAILRIESHAFHCAVIAGSEFEAIKHERPIRLRAEEVGLLPAVSACKQQPEVFGEAVSYPLPYACTPMIEDNGSFTAYWLGLDLHLEALAMTAGKEYRDSVVAQRMLERVDLLRRLEEQSLLPAGMTVHPASASSVNTDLIRSFYKMIAMQSVNLVLVAIEDLASEFDQHDFTQQLLLGKLVIHIDGIFSQKKNGALLNTLSQTGRSKRHFAETAIDARSLARTKIPAATYRLQLHQNFTLAEAKASVGYLHELGISHVYASPLFHARPGSMHGYDIINHSRINPELGDLMELRSLVERLKQYHMGLILDIVPNHMGIGKENFWWMDVLENGPVSEYSDYFDIDWRPIKPELYGKVTVPVLGESYGSVLSAGQLKVDFIATLGKLVVRYWDHVLPLNPVSYPTVLGNRLDVLTARLGKDNLDVIEYHSILTAFSRLPITREPSQYCDRMPEQRLQFKRLADLCARNAGIVEFIHQNLTLFDVQHGDAAAIQRLNALLEAQSYRLVYWRVANDEINYRRFFDINDLAAVRTEDARVFSEMHELIFSLVAERAIDGLRVDHPDGLYDPSGYFSLLQQRAGERLGLSFDPADKRSYPIYLAVEKILAPFESIQEHWPVHGSTGYDFLNDVTNLLIDSSNADRFTEIYQHLLLHEVDYESWKRASKEMILDSVLASELSVLAHRLSRIAESSWNFRDFTLNSLRTALREIVVEFPVYRTYGTPGHVDRVSRQFIEWAVRRAKKHSAANDTGVFDFIRDVLSMEARESPLSNQKNHSKFKQDVQNFAMQFQQFTGPVMAKSVEDTLFYRYNRFVCLNEVGGEPERFGTSISGFHRCNQQRQRRHPYTMLATSTHDTKRSEDVRARLAVLSEIPDLWEHKVQLWQRMNRSKKVSLNHEQAPDVNDEYLIYQTLVGACPPRLESEQEYSDFRARIQQYVLKAAREGKVHTSWVNPVTEYEQALTGFITGLLTPGPTNPFLEDLIKFESTLIPFGYVNSLVQTAVKLTAPGIPDVYQGTELWDFSLVDPDNRRAVDFELRTRYLCQFESYFKGMDAFSWSESECLQQEERLRDLIEQCDDGRLKLFLTASLLRLRQHFPDLFTVGKYLPLEARGAGAPHLVSYSRHYEGRSVIVVLPHLPASLVGWRSHEQVGTGDAFKLLSSARVWDNTKVPVGEGAAATNFLNIFTLKRYTSAADGILASQLLENFPLAVLIQL